MHGNGLTTPNGYKTRRFDDVVDEVKEAEGRSAEVIQSSIKRVSGDVGFSWSSEVKPALPNVS